MKNNSKASKIVLLGLILVGMASMGAAADFVEDFEDGDMSEYSTVEGTITTDAKQGNYAFKTDPSNTGATERDISDSAYQKVIFYIKSDDVGDNGQFRIHSSADNTWAYISTGYAGSCLSWYDPDNGGHYCVKNIQNNTWYAVEIVPDYSSNQADIYVDGSLVKANAGFPNSASDVGYFDMYTAGSESNYFDYIGFGSVVSLNEAPQFNSSSVDPDPPLIGENVSYGAEVYDPDGDKSQLSTELTVFKDGSQVYQNTKSGTPVNYSDVYAPSSGGDLDARFVTTDSAGATTTKWLNRTLTESGPGSLTVNNPTGTFNTNTISYDVDTSTDGDNKPGESLTCTASEDGTQKDQQTITEGNKFSGTYQTSSSGSHIFEVVCSESDGQQSSSSSTYTVDYLSPSIDSISNTPDPFGYQDSVDVTIQASDNTEVSQVCIDIDKDSSNYVGETCRNTASSSVSETFNDYFQVDETGSTYTINTEVTDNKGLTSTSSKSQTVTNSPPSASHSFNPTSWSYEDSVDVSYSFTDPENNIDSGSITVYKDSTKIESYNLNSNSATVNNAFSITETGSTYTVETRVQDLQGSSDTVSESQTVSNTAPTVSIDSVTPSIFRFEDEISVSYSISDNEGDIVSRNLKIFEDNSEIQSYSLSNNSGTVNNAFKTDSKNSEYKISLTATDSNSETSQTSQSQIIEDSSPQFTVNSPVNQIYGQETISWDIETDAVDDVENEVLNLTIYEDGSIVGKDQIIEGEKSTGNWDSTNGEHTFKVEVKEQDGDITSKTVQFETDYKFGNIEILNPVNDSRTESISDVNLSYSITEKNIDLNSCKYSKNGGTNISLNNCQNTTIQFGEIGDQTVTLYASDTVGNNGMAVTEFYADNKNEIRLKDSKSGTGIQEFEVIFDNGTDTSGGSTENGKYQFYTSEIPSGDVELSLRSTNYQERKENLNITDSFSLNNTYNMERTDLQFQVKDEQTEKNLHWNISFSNSTDFTEISSKVTNTTQDINYETVLKTDYVAIDEVKVDVTETSTFDGDEYNWIVVEATDLNGTTTTKDYDMDRSGGQNTFNFDQKIYQEVHVYLENRGDGGDSFDASAEAYTTNKDFQVEYKDWKDHFPVGPVQATVSNKDYKSRNYVLNIGPFSSLSQTAYLLEEGEGLYMTIETLNSAGEKLSGSTVNVQKSFDGNFKTVESKFTGTDGGSSFYVNPDIKYKAVASNPSYSTFTGTFSPVNYQFDPLQIQLGTENKYNFSTRWDTVDYKLRPETSFLNKTSGKLNWTVNDALSDISEFGIRLQDLNGNNLKTEFIRDSPTGGEITIPVNTSEFDKDQEFKVEAYFLSGDKEYRIEKNIEFEKTWDSGVFSLFKILEQSGEKAGEEAKGLMALIFTALIGTSLGKRFSKTGGGLIAVTVLGLFTMAGWFPLPIWILSFLGLLGIMMYR